MGAASKKNSTSAGRNWGFNRIYGAEDGKDTPYMTRFWIGRLRLHIFHRGDQDPDCHDHPWGFWTFPLRSYVEEVLHVQRDTVPEPKFLGYFEGEPIYDAPEEKPVRYFRKLQVVRAFRLHYRPADHTHRVIGPWDGYGLSRLQLPEPKVKEGAIPTIVFTERPRRKWGFTKHDPDAERWCWVPWRKYVYEGGKYAPCSEIEQERDL